MISCISSQFLSFILCIKMSVYSMNVYILFAFAFFYIWIVAGFFSTYIIIHVCFFGCACLILLKMYLITHQKTVFFFTSRFTFSKNKPKKKNKIWQRFPSNGLCICYKQKKEATNHEKRCSSETNRKKTTLTKEIEPIIHAELMQCTMHIKTKIEMRERKNFTYLVTWATQ